MIYVSFPFYLTLRSDHQFKLCSSFIGAERSDYVLCNAPQSTIKFNKFKCVLDFYAHLIWISSALPLPSPSWLLSSPSTSHTKCLHLPHQSLASATKRAIVVVRRWSTRKCYLFNGFVFLFHEFLFILIFYFFLFLGFPPFNVHCLLSFFRSSLISVNECIATSVIIGVHLFVFKWCDMDRIIGFIFGFAIVEHVHAVCDWRRSGMMLSNSESAFYIVQTNKSPNLWQQFRARLN